MKDTHVLCTVGIIAVLVIILIFVGYATDTLPQHTHRVITTSPPATGTPVAKKKDCHCCQVTPEEIQKRLREIVNKRRQLSRSESEVLP